MLRYDSVYNNAHKSWSELTLTLIIKCSAHWNCRGFSSIGLWYPFFFNNIDGINSKVWYIDKQVKGFYRKPQKCTPLKTRNAISSGEVQGLLSTLPLVTVQSSHSNADSLTHVGPQHFLSQDLNKERKTEDRMDFPHERMSWSICAMPQTSRIPTRWVSECYHY